MIKLYIPKKRWIFNNHYDIVDQEGRFVYRHRSNFFNTKRYIVNSNNEIIFHSKTLFGLTEKHVITKNDEIITYVTAKSFFSNEIITTHADYSFIVSRRFQLTPMPFSIQNNQREVLSIKKSDRKDCSHLIIVEESQIDFLIILMFTIIVMIEGLSPVL